MHLPHAYYYITVQFNEFLDSTKRSSIKKSPNGVQGQSPGGFIWDEVLQKMTIFLGLKVLTNNFIF